MPKPFALSATLIGPVQQHGRRPAGLAPPLLCDEDASPKRQRVRRPNRVIGATTSRLFTRSLQARSGHRRDVTGIGVQEPRSGRLAMADADLPSLSHRHLVGDCTGPAQRGRQGSSHMPIHHRTVRTPIEPSSTSFVPSHHRTLTATSQADDPGNVVPRYQAPCGRIRCRIQPAAALRLRVPLGRATKMA